MTEDDIRRIIREELAAVLSDLGTAPPTNELREVEKLTEWIGSLPPGTKGRAAELLPRFLESHSPARTCGRANWTAISFGMALGQLRGRVVRGRTIVRGRMRNGASYFEVTTVQREATPTIDATEPSRLAHVAFAREEAGDPVGPVALPWA